MQKSKGRQEVAKGILVWSIVQVEPGLTCTCFQRLKLTRDEPAPDVPACDEPVSHFALPISTYIPIIPTTVDPGLPGLTEHDFKTSNQHVDKLASTWMRPYILKQTAEASKSAKVALTQAIAAFYTVTEANTERLAEAIR